MIRMETQPCIGNRLSLRTSNHERRAKLTLRL
jgi:hypothetical protein